MNRRQFLGTSAALALSTQIDAAQGQTGETLYNGIRLPAEWPPRLRQLPADPVTPAYLTSPPAVIPIDLGRQLFVDDFLIENTTLTRTFHRPRLHDANPILRPERDWERGGISPVAMPFSDGIWYDPAERRYKMWYMGGYSGNICYAVSDDGIRWTRPELPLRRGTNMVHPGPRDSTTVWLDLEERDERRRYKLFRSHRENGQWANSLYFSADGVRWGDAILRTAPTGDRTTAFYNPFRRVWVYSLRNGPGAPRRRHYWELRDLVNGPRWERIDQAGQWVSVDSRDPQRDDLRVRPELYNLDCVAYESVLLGLFSVWRGDVNRPVGRPKINEICVGFSRDGFNWHRPDRRAFIGVSERAGDWNWGNIQSAGGCCLVVGDELYFYHSGRAGAPQGAAPRDGGCGTGLAILRRDGFASMDAGENGGTLTTRPVRFGGGHLFVNLEAASGELRAEVLDREGRPIQGLTRDDCLPVQGNRTKQAVTWRRRPLRELAGETVKFRFHLRSGKLYAFWVSRRENGASDGYVAAGGPGLTNRDS